jgi:hypothetical protein
MRGSRYSLKTLVDRTIFETMKKLFFLIMCLVALASSPVRAQVAGAQVAIVRITEYPGTVYVSMTKAEGKSEQWKFDSGSTGKRLDDSGLGYYKLLADLYQQGYRLQSTFSSGVAVDVGRTTLVLVKGQ